ncbi:MAG TPA: hypothetical protein VFV38_29845 [Ktedonobacteraceae bacterium]|nr:hypothetical protein [Ktedonobacteraceae bacterium]
MSDPDKQEESTVERQSIPLSEAITWWSWRPGMRPLYALLAGGLLSLLALFLLANGVAALLASLLDSSAPPLHVSGIVTGHTRSILGEPQLTIRLEQPGASSTITLAVGPATSTALTNGTRLQVDYAPHLHTAYALESAGRRYTLPGTSMSGNLISMLALLFSGLALLPYPALLAFWGWRDLRAAQPQHLVAYVVALRAARQTTVRTPGMIRRTTHTWYGIALQAAQSLTASEHPAILTFGIRQEIYDQLHRGDKVHITYTLHLHHLYTLKRLESA